VYSTDQADVTDKQISGLSRTVSEWTSTLVASTRLAVVKGGNRFFDQEIYGRSYTELAFERDTQSEAIGFRCAVDG
jgi:formylglycine-generating enzyme required for sulfatase activity